MIVLSEDSTEWGMAASHRRVLKEVANEENCFIIARPSEADSVRLIKDGGYGTKSMDIHDKSSTWGPMAGFVPLDQSLCKKIIIGNKENYPVLNTLELVIDAKEHKHGYEEPVHLYLSETVKRHVIGAENVVGLCSKKQIELCLSGSKITSVAELNRHPLGLMAKCKTVASGGIEAFEFKAKYSGPAYGEISTNERKRTVTETKFMITKLGEYYYAWWVFESNYLVPIIVWGYPIAEGSRQIAPVTGDYDLWMVVPHIKHWKQHYEQTEHIDRHRVASVASKFTHALIQKLNQQCHRVQLPVFNHGAEAQNFTFTQPIDLELLLITPGKRSYKLKNGDIPILMADMLTCGYLPIWNAKYETNSTGPSFSSADQERMREIRDQIYDSIETRLELIETKRDSTGSALTIDSLIKGGRASGLSYSDFLPERLEILNTDAADYLRGVTSIVMQINQAVIRDRKRENIAREIPRVASVGTTTYGESDKPFIMDTLKFIGLGSLI